MATQGQRRADARRLVAQMRRLYRTADTAGERVERELDRLTKRKTLITADQLQTLGQRVDEMQIADTQVQKAFVLLFEAITAIPS